MLAIKNVLHSVFDLFDFIALLFFFTFSFNFFLFFKIYHALFGVLVTPPTVWLQTPQPTLSKGTSSAVQDKTLTESAIIFDNGLPKS